jgi:trk system potassium uptake protein TrkH
VTSGGAVGREARPIRRTVVDLVAVANLVGMLGKYLGLVVVFPVTVALWYGDPVWPFLATGAITSGVGLGLERATRRGRHHVGVRESFLVVSVMLLMSGALAAMPYLFVGGEQLGNPIDAYLEGMSASTTTGASVVTDFDEISPSLAMWRQFTQWLGGMGIVILAVAVLPRLRVGGRQMMESELPGPEVAALPERIRQTARALWSLYIGLTIVLFLALASLGWLGIDDEMNVYEALAHSFSTIPTGGFSTQPDSIAAFSPEAQWIIALFMLLAGVNFVLLYRGLVGKKPKLFALDEEFRLYLAISVGASIVLAIQFWSYGLGAGEEAIRAGVFQAISLITTTGYATTDFAYWPVIMLLTLFLLMFAGGSAGSTTGSIKIVRHLLVGKVLRRELDQTVSPEAVIPIRVNNTPVDERTLRAIAAFILLYVGFWVVGSGVIAIDSALGDVPLSTLDVMAVSASALGNGGPGFGITGPFASFAPLGDVSKVTMIALMFLGRLEIIPVVVLLTKHYWRL